jgi:Bacteriophage tail sheath protein
MAYKTPDVYVEEIPLFPPSVAEVGTAIPAFIGYTEKAVKTDPDDLHLVPRKIRSLAEYELYFGGAHAQKFTVGVQQDADSKLYTVTSFALDGEPAGEPKLTFLLYYAVKMYFDNGGGECYIVSVNTYEKVKAASEADLEAGLAAVALEDEPTLLVIPEAVKLTAGDYGTLMKLALKQCGDLKDRFAIVDAFHGTDLDKTDDSRTQLGMDNLKYGAAYFPFIRTTLNYTVAEDTTAHTSNVTVHFDNADNDLAGYNDPDSPKTDLYNFVKDAVTKYYITMPPCGALAGVYAATDAKRGVWKAPANASLIGVIEPIVKIDSATQADLNVHPDTGKSINALRAFAGKGTMVWGARTLAGNDNEWRYISVRRFFNMVEESVKKSTYWAVFEPNDANTWVKVRGMIENYLTEKWREGALAGATTKEAFYVRCGLGVTMSAQDILEGRMNVEVGMAVVRPAEFIILKFSHKMQTS